MDYERVKSHIHAVNLAASRWAIPHCIPLRGAPGLVGYYGIPSFAAVPEPTKKRTAAPACVPIDLPISKMSASTVSSSHRTRKPPYVDADNINLALVAITPSPPHHVVGSGAVAVLGLTANSRL